MLRFIGPIVILAAAFAHGEPPATQPHDAGKPLKPPYRIVVNEQADPPNRIWVLQVDLTDPRTHVRVAPGGPDPDGDGPWQTTLLPASKIAEREGFEVAVNASFFAAQNTKDAEGKASGYREGIWASAVGWTMTDGKQWSRREEGWPVLWIDSTGRAHITDTKGLNSSAVQVVAGNTYIMHNGEARLPDKGMMLVRHPRTAVGINKDGTLLTILTVDGRRPGKSVGMTGQELLTELRKYDVSTAINLDGGGSTTLVERDPVTNELKVLNTPSDGRERAVADVIGIDAR